MRLNEIRNYEVSIWTLQDGFITVLKQANVENKGQIQLPDFSIIDDGTLEFNFKIPMYINVNGQRQENPNWYNVTNGIIIADMRKVKVIINKKDAIKNNNELKIKGELAIYEFIITKVNLIHDAETLYCLVTCLGLAFHELGKVGYKLSLTSEDFKNEDLTWFNTPLNLRDEEELPRATLQYWNNKVFKTLKHWTYEIQMDWSGYQSGDVIRDSHKVYLDSYVSAWKYDKESGILLPKQVQVSKLKLRLVDLELSNVYNITQSLALTFGVFCKYVYLHDDLYHIIGRKVIYYNNFLNEKLGALDITYPYSTPSITRLMDATDVVTKLYVKPVTDESNSDSYITIMNTPANKSGEDYLLNFDYLYNIGAITELQYQEINNYLNKMALYNSQMIPLESEIINLQELKVRVDANVTLYNNAMLLDDERIRTTDRLLNAITNNTGILQVTSEKPATGVLLSDSSTLDTSDYYLKLSQNGILPDTLHIYRTYHYTAVGTDRVSDEIFGVFEYDLFNNLINVKKLYPQNIDGTLKRTVYLTYDYQPDLYYQNIKKAWNNRLKSDTDNYNKFLERQERINNVLSLKQTAFDLYKLKKEKLAYLFSTMMGPALREGYWMPDDYNDYGDKFTASFKDGFDCGTLIKLLNNNNLLINVEDAHGNKTYNYTKTDIHGYATPIWDTISFDELQLSYYESGILQTKVYYPCIRLTELQLKYIQTHDNVSLIFYDLTMNQNLSNIRSFSIGSLCQLGFLKLSKINLNGVKEDIVFPVLFVIGADTFSALQIKTMMSTGEQVNYSSSSINRNITTSTDRKEMKDNINNTIIIETTNTIEKNSKGKLINSKKIVLTRTINQNGATSITSKTVEEDELGKIITTDIDSDGLSTITTKYTETIKLTSNVGIIITIVKNITLFLKEMSRETTGNTLLIVSQILTTIDTISEGRTATQLVNYDKIVTIKTQSSTSQGRTTVTTTTTTKITNKNTNVVETIIEKYSVTTNANNQIIETTELNSNGKITIKYNGNKITTITEKPGVATKTEIAIVNTTSSQLRDLHNKVISTTTVETKTILLQNNTLVITTTTVLNDLGKKITVLTTNILRNEYNICARLGTLTHTYVDGSEHIEINESADSVLISPKYTLEINNLNQAIYNLIQNSDWIDSSLYLDVFPRIKINSLALKDSSDLFSIIYNDKQLLKYTNYSILTRLGAYYINFKPIDILLTGKYLELPWNASKVVRINSSGNIIIPEIKIYYCLSNADTAIYLDAIQVLKENAFPKVSYEIKINIINLDFIKNVYNKIGYIAHINDNDLKFENVLGYISEVHLNFDDPSKDEIVIKNYKTKFEDLFTKIVASTLEMKKNSYVIGLAAQAFNTNGDINSSIFSSSFSKVDLNYAFNNGKLTINEKDGIWGTSLSGVVAYRGGGIFTSTTKDDKGNWVWNTGITPEGINADLITTGQLDTSKIKVYAGDRLRFQLNGDGLFAYKSFIEDLDIVSSLATVAAQDLLTYLSQETNGYTKAEYVKFTENGLFLVAENGAHIYDKNTHQYNTLATLEPITRVEVSWSGFKLRNWNNELVFYADPDTGNLILSGTIYANLGRIGGFNISDNFLATEGKTSFSDTSADGVYLGSDGISLGKGIFSVTSSGNIIAQSGIIGGWILEGNKLYSTPIDSLGNKLWSSAIVLNAYGSNIDNTYAIWAGSERPEGGATSVTYQVVDTNGNPVYINGIVRLSNGNFSRTFVTDNEGNLVYHTVTKNSSGEITAINNHPLTDSNWGEAADRSYIYYVTQRDNTSNEILSCFIYLVGSNGIVILNDEGTGAQAFQSVPGVVQKTTTVEGAAAPAPFRLRRDGALFVKLLHATLIWGTFAKLITQNGQKVTVIEDISMGNLNEQIQKLKRMGLKAQTDSSGKVTLQYVQDGDTVVNFNSAGSVRATGWDKSGGTVTVYLSNNKSFSRTLYSAVYPSVTVDSYNKGPKLRAVTLYQKTGTKGGGTKAADGGDDNSGPGSDGYHEVQAYIMDSVNGTQYYTKGGTQTIAADDGPYYQ